MTATRMDTILAQKKTATCPICNTVFEKKMYSPAKFCSTVCRREHIARTRHSWPSTHKQYERRAKKEPRECPKCGEVYATGRALCNSCHTEYQKEWRARNKANALVGALEGAVVTCSICKCRQPFYGLLCGKCYSRERMAGGTYVYG